MFSVPNSLRESALALYQPLAGDLRYVIACLKVNNDLERIADYATNIREDIVYMIRGEIIRHSGL